MEELFRDLAGLQFELPFSGRVDGLKAELIWQFLRFNQQYRDGYDRLKAHAAEDESGDLPHFFAQSWCLSTAVDYNNEVLPRAHHTEDQTEEAPLSVLLTPYFVYKPVQSFPTVAFLKDWIDLMLPILPKDKKVLVLNPYASPNQVMRYLAEQSVESQETIRALRIGHLVEYIVCHYYRKVKEFTPKDASLKYHNIFNHSNRTDTLHANIFKGNIKGFEEIVSQSPWCFFTPPHR